MTHSPAPLSQATYALLVLNGPDKGSIFKLSSNRVTIGRSAQNDICISDTRMSRNHAVITIKNGLISIKDVSDHNKVLVNGNPVESAELNPNMTIQLGETQLQIQQIEATMTSPKPSSETSTSLNLEPTQALQKRVPAAAPTLSAPSHPVQARPAMTHHSQHYHQSASATSHSARPRQRVDQGKRNFYIIVGVVGLLFIWLLTSNVKTKVAPEIRTDSTIDTEIDSNRKLVEQTEEQRRRSGLNSKQFEEAQPNFVRGFRDYRKGQYERAIESFQACLSLFPSHIQCQRYLQLSQKKFSELVQYHMILANKYKNQNQFAACKASYRNVMVMLKNPSDKTYVEAKAGYDACHTLEGDRF